MKLKLWQVDAFAERPFSGNPAAVVPLQSWLTDEQMQAIANENNLAETAFFVPRATGMGCYDLRWFTPAVEVPLCGHATLASGWVVLNELTPSADMVRFETKSGELTVAREAKGRLRMALPASSVDPFAAPAGLAGKLAELTGGLAPEELHWSPKGAGGNPGLVAVWPEAALREIRYTGGLADALASVKARGLLATAKGDEKPYDFLSRFFAPRMGVHEDPVTGSANCALTRFWSKRLGKKSLRVWQASPRGGDLLCTDEVDHITLSGPCALYMRGEIEV
ncbi:MAG: PhzF family phenazine biosynthesis protein, partial [bacterium]